jgi:hypothetical protein
VTVNRKNLGPLLVALLTVEILVGLWAAYRIDDILWQVHRVDTLRAELVAKKRALVSSGKLNLSPEAQKQFVALLRILESDDAYQRSLISGRAEFDLFQLYMAFAIFAIQLILSLFFLFRSK